MDANEHRLSKRDLGAISTQAILRGIPYIGPSLEHFIYGPMAELRMRRLEDTLREVGETLQRMNAESHVDSEEFVNLLEEMGPAISKETDKEKLKWFRNLLIGAAQLKPGDAKWAEARLASTLIKEIDAPGLAILAAVGRNWTEKGTCWIVSRPHPQAVAGRFDWGCLQPTGEPLHYPWPIIAEWVMRLQDRRLISFDSGSRRGGYDACKLTQLGVLLTSWARNRNSEARDA